MNDYVVQFTIANLGIVVRTIRARNLDEAINTVRLRHTCLSSVRKVLFCGKVVYIAK